jgi:hypothetical protein
MCCDAHTTSWHPLGNFYTRVYGPVCSGCASFGWGLFGIGLVTLAIFFFAYWLPGWLETKKKQEEFDRNWQKQRNDFHRR